MANKKVNKEKKSGFNYEPKFEIHPNGTKVKKNKDGTVSIVKNNHSK